MSGFRRIPEATVSRLPLYLRSLLEFTEQRVTTVSSERLATTTGVNAAKVRKDLSYLGSYGTRGVGYDVEYLLRRIQEQLGLDHDWRVAIVGVGNLGRALVNYRGFGERRFSVQALFDSDMSKIGTELNGLVVAGTEDIEPTVRERRLSIGIIATPAASAQDVADRLVDGGVTGILNFAPAVISVPKQVRVRKVDLSIELQILAFYVSGTVSDEPHASR
ncbi:MAG: redox-sensing transcriptional repressor Rex [Actinobacteria bacterium ATB1]|nr:redox-sensing transcriptional repressor Rex [Actinobacteria bacterium ATB1]